MRYGRCKEIRLRLVLVIVDGDGVVAVQGQLLR